MTLLLLLYSVCVYYIVVLHIQYIIYNTIYLNTFYVYCSYYVMNNILYIMYSSQWDSNKSLLPQYIDF